MAQTHAHDVGRGSRPSHHMASGGAHPHHEGRLSPFWRHFLEMLGAMVVGMIATGAIFGALFVGVKSWDEVTIQYPTQALLAMAVGMTLPMVLWMRYRGMSWRNSAEMAAAMVLPVIPFLCLPCLVRSDRERTVRCILRGHGRRDVHAHAIPAGRVRAPLIRPANTLADRWNRPYLVVPSLLIGALFRRTGWLSDGQAAAPSWPVGRSLPD